MTLSNVVTSDDTDRIIPVATNHVTFQTSAWGETKDYSGWILRILPNTDRDLPNGYLFVSDNGEGQVSYLRANTRFITRTQTMVGEIPKLIHEIAFHSYQARLEHKAVIQAINESQRVQNELHALEKSWEEKIAKAAAEADERGYCGEFENICEAAGIDVPEEEEHTFYVWAKVKVQVSKSARTEEGAKKWLEDNGLDDAVTDVLSGYEEVEDCEFED